MRAEVGTEAGIRPGQVLGSLGMTLSVLAVHEVDQFVALNLGIGTEVAVVNEPLAHLRVSPATPRSILSAPIVVADELLKLLALDLSVGFDNVVLNLINLA